MQKYIGTKTISAKPMKLGEFIDYKQRELAKNANRDDDGYFVVYENGHESWSPKDVFEQSYQLADTPKQRAEIELTQLKERINQLDTFIRGTTGWENLTSKHQSYLIVQRDIMWQYETILQKRLKYWECK